MTNFILILSNHLLVALEIIVLMFFATVFFQKRLSRIQFWASISLLILGNIITLIFWDKIFWLKVCKENTDSRNRTILLKMRTTEVAGFLYLENSTARDVEIRDNRIVLRETGSLEHGYGLKNVMAVLDCMDALYVFDYRQSEHLLSFSAQFSIAP
mgnify:FL=1